MSKRLDLLTQKYIQLRDCKKEVADRHKEELAPLNEGMKKIENAVLQELSEQGLDSAKTPHGTPYISRKRSYKVVDFEALLPVMLENPDLIVRRVSTEAADEIIEETSMPIAGLEMNVERKVNFRR